MKEKERSVVKSDFRVLCIGRMVMDILAYPIVRMPYEEEALPIKMSKISFGGSAANTAVELSRLGITSYICGLLGTDSLSYKLRDTLQSHGVNTDKLIFEEDKTSSFCFVPIGEMGQPRYLYYLGNNSNISYEKLSKQLDIIDYIKTEFITHVHIAGINLLPQLDGEGLCSLLKDIKEISYNVTISIDTSKVLKNAKSNLQSLKYIDIFFCNEREGQAIAGSTNIFDIVRFIAPQDGTGAKQCIIKLGSRGAAVYHYLDKNPKICSSYKVKEKNLNGAGDVFIAKFLETIFVSGINIEELRESKICYAADLANHSAAEFVGTKLGSDFKRKRVDKNAKRPLLSGVYDIRGPDKTIFLKPDHVKHFDQFRKIDNSIIDIWVNNIHNLLETTRKRNLYLLDVGSGTGRFTISFANALSIKNLTIFAIDHSPSMVEILKEKIRSQGIQNVITLTEDFNSFKSDVKFDLVFLSEIIHLMWDIDDLLYKVRSILQPNGIVALRAPSHSQLRQHEWYDFFPGTLEIDLRRHRDIDYLYSTLDRCKFRKIEIKEVDETEVMPTMKYIETFKSKAYSTLHLLDQDFFNEYIENMNTKLLNKKMMRRVMKMCMITAQKI